MVRTLRVGAKGLLELERPVFAEMLAINAEVDSASITLRFSSVLDFGYCVDQRQLRRNLGRIHGAFDVDVKRQVFQTNFRTCLWPIRFTLFPACVFMPVNNCLCLGSLSFINTLSTNSKMVLF